MVSKKTLILLGILFLTALCFGGGVYYGQSQIKADGEDYLNSNPAVNINIADKETLMAEAGIGPKTAERIITSREEEGEYENTHELVERKILGEEKYSEISSRITVD